MNFLVAASKKCNSGREKRQKTLSIKQIDKMHNKIETLDTLKYLENKLIICSKAWIKN